MTNITDAKPNLLTRIASSGLFLDALSAVLLSTGCLMALLVPTELNSGLFACLTASAVSVIFIVLLSRRWWLPLCLIVGFAILFISYNIWADDFAYTIEYLKSLINWIVSGAYYAQDVTDPVYLTVMHTVISFAVTLVLFVLIRKLFFFPGLFLVQAGTLILSNILMDSDLSIALCLSAGGLIILLPKVYARRIVKRGEALGDAVRHAETVRARMQIVAIPIAVLSVLLALWIVPKDTQKWKSHQLNVWVNDIGTLIDGPFKAWPESFSSFSMYQMGFQSETGRLGGPVTLNDEVYLSVRSPRPVLLKGRIFDYYDGSNWGVSVPDGDLRLNSPFWNGEKRETFDFDMPVGNAEAKELYGRLTTETEVTLYYYKRAFNTLFAPENVRDIAFNERFKNPEAYFNRRSELFMHTFPSPNLEYTVSSRVWDTGMRGFDEFFLQLEEHTHDQKRYFEIAARYTQLPDTLPDDVYRMATEITEGIVSPFLKARAISQWLAENAEYTLEPDMPPDDIDFTAHFLDTREGYCVYFATAMTVLARCADLPARYVTGFALEIAPDGNRYLATGRTAHAWSEVYFEGIGWLPVDPLNWNAGEINNDTADSESPVENAYQPTETPFAASENDQSEGLIPVWLPILVILVLCSLFLLAVLVGPRYKSRVWTYDAVRRRQADTTGQLQALYNDTLRLLALHDLTVHPGETLVTFPKRADRSIVFEGITLSEIAGALMRWYFGDVPPADGEIVRTCLYHEYLEALTLERLGKIRYMFKRVMGVRRTSQKQD